ncbi:hypothetical protein [Rhizorhabdus argentea]|uniref:hypothetical protein n=1 Tax=Rhizorhabdus argentea TaxID=1387174 RepID=UPI0030EDBB8A
MALPSRRDILDAQDEPAKPASATVSCPCCDAPLARVDGVLTPCGQCGYPDNSAAWVNYDGCC